jgi:uncharacterized protein (DUF3084 family)
MLFWFIPGVRGFHESVIASLTQVRTSLGLLEESANRIAAIQQQVAERLDRVEGEVSRLSVRADVLVQLQSSMQQLSQRIDAVGGSEAAARDLLIRAVEQQRGVVEELHQCMQREQQAREALEKRVDRGTD